MPKVASTFQSRHLQCMIVKHVLIFTLSYLIPAKKCMSILLTSELKVKIMNVPLYSKKDKYSKS